MAGRPFIGCRVLPALTVPAEQHIDIKMAAKFAKMSVPEFRRAALSSFCRAILLQIPPQQTIAFRHAALSGSSLIPPKQS